MSEMPFPFSFNNKKKKKNRIQFKFKNGGEKGDEIFFLSFLLLLSLLLPLLAGCPVLERGYILQIPRRV